MISTNRRISSSFRPVRDSLRALVTRRSANHLARPTLYAQSHSRFGERTAYQMPSASLSRRTSHHSFRAASMRLKACRTRVMPRCYLARHGEFTVDFLRVLRGLAASCLGGSHRLDVLPVGRPVWRPSGCPEAVRSGHPRPASRPGNHGGADPGDRPGRDPPTPSRPRILRAQLGVARLSACWRLAHPPHGLTPTALVAAATASPKPGSGGLPLAFAIAASSASFPVVMRNAGLRWWSEGRTGPTAGRSPGN